MAKTNAKENIAAYIENTLLKPDALAKDIDQLCQEAIDNKLYGVCVPPYFIRQSCQTLMKSDVKVISVVGFPMGYSSTSSKVEEVKKAINDGVDELDMVLNIAALKNMDEKFLRNDIDSVLTATRWSNKILKVIIESAALTKDEIIRACQLCAELEVDFVKTSTGLHAAGGASVKAVQLIRDNLPKNIKVKASGGIKTAEFTNKLIQAGADRIGTSSGVQIVQS